MTQPTDVVGKAAEPEGATPPTPSPRRGPKTVKGKERVRMNAIRHGLAARDPVIPGIEQFDEWEAFRDELRDQLAPVGAVEAALADRIIVNLWRLRRVFAYENAVLEARRQDVIEIDGDPRTALFPSNSDQIVRYEAHVSRELYRALHELEAWQGRRRGERVPLARIDVHGLAGEAERPPARETA